MSIENKNTAASSSETAWDSLSEYGAEHPFNNDSQIASIEEQPAKPEQIPLSVIRQKHVDFLMGKYSPSEEDWDLFKADEDFYASKEYRSFRKFELDNATRDYVDIYNPSHEKVQENIQPCLELVENDSDTLYNAGCLLEKDTVSKDDISNLIDFFAEKFGIESPSNVVIMDRNENGDLGYYDNFKKEMGIQVDQRSAAEIISVISHEMWHIHQRASENEDYKTNFDFYYHPLIDYEQYSKQLIEKEAFVMCATISNTYRNEDLKRHPEKIPDLHKKYDKWLSHQYTPSSVDEQEYIILAHEFKAPTIFDRLNNFFKKEKR